MYALKTVACSWMTSTRRRDAVGDKFGAAVALSADGTVLAVGASYNDAGGNADAGQVKGVPVVRCD